MCALTKHEVKMSSEVEAPMEVDAPVVADTRVSLSAVAEYSNYGVKNEQPCWAITSLKAPFYEPTARAPVDIVAVIDKSGSMAGEKISLVRETLLFVIDQCKCASIAQTSPSL